MKNILLIGAGKSSNVLVDYLLTEASENDWMINIVDIDPETVKKKFTTHDRLKISALDIRKQDQLEATIETQTLVISLLPAHMHVPVAEACIKLGKNMITASYVSDEMRALDEAAKKADVLLLNEMGLDPGIDHMSAMQLIHRLKKQGASIDTFESFTGGLLAPESEADNPWQYKFTWNPRNVVLAGQGVSKFLHEGKLKYIPYHRLFHRTEIIHIPPYGYFGGYANRDSLKYQSIYGLEKARTIYRGTLRRPGFSRTWNVFVQLGATDDSYQMDCKGMSYKDFINSFLYFRPKDSVELKLAHYLNLDLDSEVMYKLRWLGIFSNKKVGLEKGTPAQILQKILEDRWTLKEDEKDMIVMWHKFIYKLKDTMHELHSSMVCIGENQRNTAMAKCVGLPLGLAAKLLLSNAVESKGVQLPVLEEIYKPVLRGLEEKGIVFEENEAGELDQSYL
ncbi:MAG: saccharopine dehydrogenase C-terminal domain-containing protein [Chitinophagales bacterium]